MQKLAYSASFTSEHRVQIDLDHASEQDLTLSVYDTSGLPALEGNSVTLRADPDETYWVELACSENAEPVTYSLSFMTGMPQNIQEY